MSLPASAAYDVSTGTGESLMIAKQGNPFISSAKQIKTFPSLSEG